MLHGLDCMLDQFKFSKEFECIIFVIKMQNVYSM